MNKLENGLFSELTKQVGFYIKDYYSEFLKETEGKTLDEVIGFDPFELTEEEKMIRKK